jgi:thiol:disulfide interchange protein
MSARLVLLAALGVLGFSGLDSAWPLASRADAGIAWLRDEAQAVSEAQRARKLVLVNASAEWCAACKLLGRNTWADTRVQQVVRERFVPLRIDFTDNADAPDPRIEAYRVEGLPTVIVCVPLKCSASAARRSTGYLAPREMLAFLSSQN